MRKALAVAVSVLIVGGAALYANQPPPTLNERVLTTIARSQQIPGLQSHEMEVMKPKLVDTWDALVATGHFQLRGSDKEARSTFVTLQAVVEHALSEDPGITRLTGIIHTPTPTTPLCTEGTISPHLVAPSIAADPECLFTVKARTTTLRDFLAQEGTLYVVYPEGGLEKRTEAQQKIYKQELVNHMGHLWDCPLDCKKIPDEMIGATYVFVDKEGETCAFSLRITQANDPRECGTYMLWFGSTRNPLVRERVQSIMQFVQENGQPGIKTPLLHCSHSCACLKKAD